MAASDASSVKMVVTYDKDILMVCITPRKAVGSIRRPGHFTLFVDVSGSMAEHLANVIKILHKWIDSMEPIDYLSIISYHSVASIVLNTVPMSGDRTPFHTAVDSLHPLGGTNLQCAFVEIPNLITPPTDVFLLTDGLIMEGMNRPDQLLRLAESVLATDTPLHTLGIGATHDQSLLRDMSVRTFGSYTYATGVEAVGSAMGSALAAQITNVGQNTRLMIPSGYKSLELNYTDGAAHVSVGRLIDEKTYYVVLQKIAAATDPTAAAAAATDPTAAAAAATDPTAAAAAATPTELTIPVMVDFYWSDATEHVEHVLPVPTEEPILMMEQVLRATTAKNLSIVTDHMIKREFDMATLRLEELKVQLDTSPAAGRILIIQFRAQVDGMLDEMKSAGAAPLAPPALARMLSSGASAAADAANQSSTRTPSQVHYSRALSMPEDPSRSFS